MAYLEVNSQGPSIFSTLSKKSVDNSLGKLLFLQMFRHIYLVEIERIPDLTGRKHFVDGSQDHPGDGNDRTFLPSALCNLISLLSVTDY